MPSSAATLLTLLAVAGSTLADTGFGLRAYSTRSGDISGWAVVNEHLDAGHNYIAVQRPSAYTPDQAFIKGTMEQKHDHVARLAFLPPGSDELYEAQIPYKPVASNLVRVETQLGKGTQTFGIADGETGTEVDLLAFNDKHGFWVCPETIYESEGDVFVLYYGIRPTKVDRPSPECQPVRLQAEGL